MPLAALPEGSLAALYGRQSKANEESIDEQLTVLKQVCADEGWSIYRTFQDPISASRFEKKAREEWQALRADLIAKRFQVLLLWESSRGDRDLETWVAMLARCRELGVYIYVHTHERLYNLQNARDWKSLATDGIDNAYSSEETSLRWRRHTAARAAAGKPHGFVAYGWIRRTVLDDDGVAVGTEDVLHPEHAALLREAKDAVLTGESLRSIASRFNAAGRLSPRGEPWNSTTLRQVLQRKRNAGVLVHRGVDKGEGNWPPLWDRETQTRLDVIFKDPARRTSRGSVRRYLGSGIYLCGREGCDGIMRVSTPTKGYGSRAKQPPRYQCRECLRVARPQAKVDELVEWTMITRLSQPDAVAALAQGNPGRANELREQIAGLEARLLDFADQAADGAIDAGQLARINAKLKPQIEKARGELAQCHPIPGVMQLAGDSAAERWRSAPLDVRREVLRSLAVVTILPVGSGQRFSPESVRIEWRRRDPAR